MKRRSCTLGTCRSSLILAAPLWFAACIDPRGDESRQEVSRMNLALPAEIGALDPARRARLERIKAHIRQREALRARLPAPVLERLPGLSQLDTLIEELSKLEALARSAPGNDPRSEDDFLNRFEGMNQFQPSVAWCGKNALLGFFDMGSGKATLLGRYSPSGSWSSIGYAVSTDAGRSFVDRGALISDPIPADVRFRELYDQPTVRCTGQKTFYLASTSADVSQEMEVSYGVSVSRSLNGGSTFGGAVRATIKSSLAHYIDSPSMDVMPGPIPARDILVLTYIDYDSTGTSAACPGTFRVAVESVRSLDGGATWGAPVSIDQRCDFSAVLASPQVRFGLGDDVHVAWEGFGDTPSREIRVSKSTDGGASFSAPVLAGVVTQVGDGVVAQGGIGTYRTLHGLAVDRSNGSKRGAVYLSWHDGRFVQQADPLAQDNTYRFGDILLARSTDGGASWSAPVRVNDDAPHQRIDQLMPTLEVNREGNVFVLFYDRRRDRRNFLFDTFLAVSRDGGKSFENRRVTERRFLSGGFREASLATDRLQQDPGVIMAWADRSRADLDVITAKGP